MDAPIVQTVDIEVAFVTRYSMLSIKCSRPSITSQALQTTFTTVGSRRLKIKRTGPASFGIGGARPCGSDGLDQLDQRMPSDTRTRHSKAWLGRILNGTSLVFVPPSELLSVPSNWLPPS